MNLFGDTNNFAIEITTEEFLVAPSSPWGRMRIWCMGFPIGDIDEPHCGLGAVRMLRDFLDEIDSLWLEEFENLSDFELFELIDYKIFGVIGNEIVDDARTDDEVGLDFRNYYKFVFLTNWGEMFDHAGKCFIFKVSVNKLKILNRPLDGSRSTFSLFCDIKAFRKVVDEANTWLDSESERLKYQEFLGSDQSPAPSPPPTSPY